MPVKSTKAVLNDFDFVLMDTLRLVLRNPVLVAVVSVKSP